MENVPDSLQRIDLEEDSVPVSYLGSGCYSAAFRGTEERHRVFLLVEVDAKDTKRDRSKEVLALARTYHSNKHLPVLVKHGTQGIDGSLYEIWETRYSKSAPRSSNDAVSPEAEELSNTYPVEAREVAQKVKTGELHVEPSLVQALRDIERACKVFGLSKCRLGVSTKYYSFDLNNANFGLEPDTQTLILRDPINAFF